jgi:cytidyltransferase-like protein
MNRANVGLVLGRFQPVHLGHLEYLEAALAACEHLVIGVTNPDRRRLLHHDADPKRSEASSNPLGYVTRSRMLTACLTEDGHPADRFTVVPADLSDIASFAELLPPRETVTFLATVYDRWGEVKVQTMASAGFATRILWRRDMTTRIATGASIREAWRRGDATWRSVVPPATARILAEVPCI